MDNLTSHLSALEDVSLPPNIKALFFPGVPKTRVEGIDKIVHTGYFQSNMGYMGDFLMCYLYRLNISPLYKVIESS